MSGADLETMTSIYVGFRDADPAYPDLYPPGSVAAYKGLGALMPDSSEWALVQFSLTSSTPTLQQQAGMQDGAALGVFLRASPSSQWLLRGVVGEPACAGMPQLGVPVGVRTLWGVPPTCPS